MTQVLPPFILQIEHLPNTTRTFHPKTAIDKMIWFEYIVQVKKLPQPLLIKLLH